MVIFISKFLYSKSYGLGTECDSNNKQRVNLLLMAKQYHVIPKCHEEWIRNNSRANERNRCNERPHYCDRSRNFERRRENMQNHDFQNAGPSPVPNQAGPNSGPGQYQNNYTPDRDAGVNPGPNRY
ncbi:hypothetical protein FF1_030942 [Malus domestica]